MLIFYVIIRDNIDRNTGQKNREVSNTRSDAQAIPLSKVLERIGLSDEMEINEIIRTVIHRYQKLHPAWELIVLTVPRNSPSERKQILESILKLEQQQKRTPDE